MLSLFNALSSKAYFVLVIGLCSLLGFKALAGEFKIAYGQNHYVVISEENAQYFYRYLSSRKRSVEEEKFWAQVSDYFRKLPELVSQNEGQIIDIDDFIFPMGHHVATKILVRNENLIRPDLAIGKTIKAETVDQMIMRDSVQIIYDYYYAMMAKEVDISVILKTIGAKGLNLKDKYQTLGMLVHPFDVNEKYLGNKFLNNHAAAQEWLQLLGKVSMKEALDLAYKDEFYSPQRHPLLGGGRSDVHKYFKALSALYANIFNFMGEVDRDATASFESEGNIKIGQTLSIYICHYNLKLDIEITDEFKMYCDTALYKAFNATKSNSHPMKVQFDKLNTRYNISLQ